MRSSSLSGDAGSFSEAGGMVIFTVADEKVRFEINAAAAERAGLKVSAQLLKLATMVRRKS